jgi:probable rRNA maturation factor
VPLDIEIADEQTAVTADADRLRQAVALVMSEAGITGGEISLALVDDPTIHELNNRWLQHDEPTDVLSFALAREGDRLEGEIIVSGDTAARMASQYGWEPADELLLYVIHGALHLVGYDDLDPANQAEMRRRERHFLERFGVAAEVAMAARPDTREV